jgi:hypothetical protein
MNTTRRQIFHAFTLPVLAAGKKRVLAIVGDAYHAPAYLDGALVGGLRKSGWEAVTIIDYDVPWDDFSKYDLIILSREAHEYVKYFRDRDVRPSKGRALWITPQQEQKFEDYVNAGGRLFLYHDGFGFYPKGGAVSRAAKAFFIRHPAIVSINVKPTGKMPELTQGITPFTVADEEYEVEMDESQTSVFLESHSPEHGRFAQAWAHPYGKGKVVVFIPGHGRDTISHPMVQRSVQNILAWLTK